MNRKTGKISFVCSCTDCPFLFAGVIIFFTNGISSAAEVTLAWDANTEPDLMGYKIYYDTSPGDPYYGTDADQGISPITVLCKDLDHPSNPKFTLTGLGANEDYYFALTAFDNENLESGYSNEASTAGGNNGGGSSGGGGCFTVTSAIGLTDF
jgi:chitinase